MGIKRFTKQKRTINNDDIEGTIYGMDVIVVIEGHIKYLLARNHSNGFDIFNNTGIDMKHALSPKALDGTKEEFLMKNRQVPADIIKFIIEQANVNQLGCREISKELEEKHNFKLSYRTVARIIKEDRDEKSEQLKSLKLEECIKSLPRDLQILDEIISDLYGIFKMSADINVKLKVCKELRGTIETKLSNFIEKKQEEQSPFCWEKYLDENECDEYLY